MLLFLPQSFALHMIPPPQHIRRSPLPVATVSGPPDAVQLYGADEAWLADGIAAVRAQNPEVQPLLEKLRGRRFFRLYAADLLAGCSYMPTSEEPCELGECEVDAVDEVPSELVNRSAAHAAACIKWNRARY